MAKCKPLTKEQKLKARWQDADQAIREQIALLLFRSGLTYETLAVRLGISDRTLRDRRKHPETFTMLELRRLAALAEEHHIEINVYLTKEGAA